MGDIFIGKFKSKICAAYKSLWWHCIRHTILKTKILVSHYVGLENGVKNLYCQFYICHWFEVMNDSHFFQDNANLWNRFCGHICKYICELEDIHKGLEGVTLKFSPIGKWSLRDFAQKKGHFFLPEVDSIFAQWGVGLCKCIFPVGILS